MPREIDVECMNCGLKERAVEGDMGVTISHKGRFSHKGKTCQWPGIAMAKDILTKEDYDSQKNKWKENSRKFEGCDFQAELKKRKKIEGDFLDFMHLKKLERFESLWKKEGVETFKCPECGKETLKWTVTKNYEV